jgi:hypothetical protein
MDESEIREHRANAEQHLQKGEELIEQITNGLKEAARDGHPTAIHEETSKTPRDVEKTPRDVEKTLKRNRGAVRKRIRGGRIAVQKP